MSFFSNMGNVWFPLPDGENVLMNNITKRVTLPAAYKTNPQLTLLYQINDGDRPDLLSKRLYGVDDYAYSIMLVNDIFDYTDQWPRTDIDLMNYISDKYPYYEANDPHHYVNIDGFITDPTAVMIRYGLPDIQSAMNRENLTAVSILDYETQVNDAKRHIKVVDPDYITKLDASIKAQLA